MTTSARGHDGESRARVLSLLRAADGPLAVAEIGRLAGLAAATTRFHLDHLVSAGLVRPLPEERSGRPGRPRTLYRAVPQEAVDDGAAYRLLAGLLAAELVRANGGRAAVDAGRHWAQALLPAGTARTTDGDRPDGVLGAVRDLFDEGGFAPSVVDDSTLALHRCPFVELAREQSAAVCGVHLGLLQGVLDSLGSDRRPHLDVVLDGSRPCLVRLGPPGTAA